MNDEVLTADALKCAEYVGMMYSHEVEALLREVEAIEEG